MKEMRALDAVRGAWQSELAAGSRSLARHRHATFAAYPCAPAAAEQQGTPPPFPRKNREVPFKSFTRYPNSNVDFVSIIFSFIHLV
jgi:hypothetical protein